MVRDRFISLSGINKKFFTTKRFDRELNPSRGPFVYIPRNRAFFLVKQTMWGNVQFHVRCGIFVFLLHNTGCRAVHKGHDILVNSSRQICWGLDKAEHFRGRWCRAISQRPSWAVTCAFVGRCCVKDSHRIVLKTGLSKQVPLFINGVIPLME